MPESGPDSSSSALSVAHPCCCRSEREELDPAACVSRVWASRPLAVLSKTYFTIEHNPRPIAIGALPARAPARPTAVVETAHTPPAPAAVQAHSRSRSPHGSRSRRESGDPEDWSEVVVRLREIERSIDRQTTRIDAVEARIRAVEEAHSTLNDSTEAQFSANETAHTVLWNRHVQHLDTTRLLLGAVASVREAYEVRDAILRQARDQLPRLPPTLLRDVRDRLREQYAPSPPRSKNSSVALEGVARSKSSSVALEDGRPGS